MAVLQWRESPIRVGWDTQYVTQSGRDPLQTTDKQTTADNKQ